RRDGRQVSLAEGPFLAHEAASLLPIGFFHGYAHFLGHFRNALEAVLHRALAPDMRLEDFPVVDAMLARLAGVSDHHAALKLVEIDAQFNAMFAAGRMEKLGDFREEREAIALGFYESRKGSKTFFPFDVARDQLDTAIVGIIGLYDAGGIK